MIVRCYAGTNYDQCRP